MSLANMNGIAILGYRIALPEEWVWANGGIHQGPSNWPVMVIAPEPGYDFRYDITTDTNRVTTAGEVIPSTEAIELLMSFDAALAAMKTGLKVRRAEWPEIWLEIREQMLPHLCEMPRGVNWNHTSADMAAKDWKVLA
jgi:hypothetical protein